MLNCGDKPDQLELDAVLANQVDHVSYQNTFVCSESYHPMCSPNLAAQTEGKPLPEALADLPLIDIDQVNIWSLWQQTKGHELPNANQPILFSHTLLLLQAALYGQGVALLEKSLVKNELTSGELVCLDEDGFVPDHTAYYLSLIHI